MSRARSRIAGGALISLLFMLSGPIYSEARPESDRAGGRAMRPSGDEIVIGSLSPDRPESGPRNHLAAPDCAQADGSRDGRGCSEEAGEPGGPHQASNSFKGGPGCAIQCITSGVAYAVGAGAKLVVKTDTAALIVIEVEGFPPHVSEAGAMETSALFADLQPGTTYEAQAWATDGQGYTSHASGSFTTLRRFASVEFGQFDLESSAAGGDGVFRFFFRVGGSGSRSWKRPIISRAFRTLLLVIA